MPTLYLIDVSSFIYRAFFAIRNLRNREGQPTNAVYGVANMLARLVDEAKPEYLAVVYDSREPSFRKQEYAEYKANRSAPPDDLIPQFGWVEDMIRCMGIPTFRQSGIEADDLIATLAKRWSAAGADRRVVIVSGDKDLMQLVDAQVSIWDTMSEKFYTPPEVENKFGVRPDQIRDYLGLIGDSSDNIPGVTGVGPKTAVDLLKQYGTLEKVLEAAVDGKVSGKKGEVIRSQVEQARLSARLVTLKDDCDVMPEPEHLRYRFQVSDECAALLVKFDFHSLLKKWHPIAQKHSVEPEKTVEPALRAGLDAFRTVDKHDAFAGLLAALERSGEFALDLETTSLNPRDAAIVGFSFSYDPSFGVYVPVGHRGTDAPQLSLDFVLSELKPLLENPRIKKIGQNFKYDLSVLAQHGIQLRGIGADTMVASYVLDPEGRHNLETLAARHFGYKVLTYEEVCGDLSFDLISIPMATRYSAEDAWVTLNLWHVLRDKIQAEGLMEIFAKVDLPLVPVLARMESEGVCIDEPWLRQLGRDFERALLAIDQKVQAYSKSGPLNLNSPKQLGRLLFEELQLPVQSRTKTGYSTDASVLEALAPLHEVPRMLLEYREISKLKGTYVDPLPGMRDPKTGRIHASFHQAVTATGRLSSSDPNLQNIPIRTERGKLIRRAFIARSENVLLSADYSQIELRLLAHMSGDAELLSAFKNDDDVHRRTAAEIFGVASDAVTEQQRGFAKAINFGLMYGKTAFGLAQELKIGRREAQDMITRYFERYSGVKAFLDKQVADARERGWTVTLLGRKRYLPDINNRNAAMRTNAERMAMNAPIQGTAADLMKLAMIEIDERLHREGYSSRLMVQVHDEVVLDCPKTEVAAVTKLVVESMEQAMTLDVPLKVNAATGLNWMEL